MFKMGVKSKFNFKASVSVRAKSRTFLYELLGDYEPPKSTVWVKKGMGYLQENETKNTRDYKKRYGKEVKLVKTNKKSLKQSDEKSIG
jgi:hypothetical protein